MILEVHVDRHHSMSDVELQARINLMTDKARATDSARKENRDHSARLLEDLIPEFNASDGASSFGQIVKLNCPCSK